MILKQLLTAVLADPVTLIEKGIFAFLSRRSCCFASEAVKPLFMKDRTSSSPVYFYSIDAQLKTVIDRTVARWTEIKNKEFYYIVTCADDAKASQETTIACFRGFADCVEGAMEKGIIYGTGVYKPGEIRNNTACSQAYNMGKSI